MKLPEIIALDMDGTLLDAGGHMPPGFWDILAELQARGAHVAPASGRQLATLQNMFADAPVPPDTYIAENGAVVWHDGEIIASSAIKKNTVRDIISLMTESEFANDLVLATPLVAYVNQGITNDRLANVNYYYHATEKVSDFDDVIDNNDVVKVAIHVHGDAERDVLPLVSSIFPDYSPVVSAPNWVDVMEPGTHKGVAMTQIVDKLGVDVANTASFGDYLNDYELLKASGYAVAMENAHPQLKEIAHRIAPSNVDYGVMTVLREWLDESSTRDS